MNTDTPTRKQVQEALEWANWGDGLEYALDEVVVLAAAARLWLEGPTCDRRHYHEGGKRCYWETAHQDTVSNFGGGVLEVPDERHTNQRRMELSR